jgi:glycosyltransferase involved in cell wall biosynthesis
MHSSLPQQLENFKFTRSRLLVRIFRMLEDSALRGADAVLTICPDLRDYALKSGVQPARHVLIENSIFDDVRLKAPTGSGVIERRDVRSKFEPQARVICYAGTFEAYQGIEILVRAFALVASQRADARLLLVGGTEEQVVQVRALATELNLDDKCVLTGRVSKGEAMEYTQSAHVLVSPRVTGTNTPLKIYEQLASRKPLVATRIWSHTQVLDDSVCYLVEPEPESLAHGLLDALDDLGRTTQRADNAHALYEREYARPVYESKIQRLLEILRPARSLAEEPPGKRNARTHSE